MGSTTSVCDLHNLLALRNLSCNLFADTAQSYQIESEVGKAVADSGLARDEFWITSKVCTHVQQGRNDARLTPSRSSLDVTVSP